MLKLIFGILISLLLFSCDSGQHVFSINEPVKHRQWINALFFNDNFDSEISFPVWFDDSLVKSNGIQVITKRIFPRIYGDTSSLNTQQDAMPREKREYYFDDNGFVDQLVIYYYFDDREIARANFLYRGNMDNNGVRTAIPGSFKYLSEKDDFTDFRTNDQSEREYSFIICEQIQNSKKYATYKDIETEDKLFFLKQAQYWGTLSVDSILNPAANDWIIWGTARKPHKRYKVENKVKEKEVHLYHYWKSGVLKERIIENYPFENRRSYRYNQQNQWISYIDSTFSENDFITRTENFFEFDPQGRPIVVRHQRLNGNSEPFSYFETISYRFKK